MERIGNGNTKMETGMSKWRMGNGELVNRKWGIGNWEMENGKLGNGNGKWECGKGELEMPMRNAKDWKRVCGMKVDDVNG